MCESPYVELYWAGEDSYGKIEVEDKLYEVVFSTTAGPQMMVFDKEMTQEAESDMDFEYCLFRGHTTYGQETAIVKVEEDFKNIFNGDLPTLNFKRYDKEEYLKGKDSSNDSELLNRSSFNFEIAVYDCDTDRMYYFEFDT